MSRKSLILVGGGGHARACADVINTNKKYKIIGYTDVEENKLMSDYNYLGTDDILSNYINNSFFIITIGQIKYYSKRKELFDYLKKNKANLISIESCNSYVSKNSCIGVGTIIMHGAIIQTNVKVGENCIVNDRALIEHDVTIGNNCHISTSSVINGNVKVGDGVFIGSGAIIKNGVKIANNCVIGMGVSLKTDVLKINTIIKN